MPTESQEPGALRRNLVPVAVLGSLTIFLAAILWFALRPPPQMGTSEAVFRTVDALYTAVRNEDLPRVAECEAKLRSHRADGKLPQAAADTLDGVIAEARSGRWRPAAESLHAFMQGQRRDAGIDHDHEKKMPIGKGKGR